LNTRKTHRKIKEPTGKERPAPELTGISPERLYQKKKKKRMKKRKLRKAEQARLEKTGRPVKFPKLKGRGEKKSLSP